MTKEEVVPWYDIASDLTNEEKLEVLQIILNGHLASGNSEAIAMVKEWERILSDRIAEKELLDDIQDG